MELWLLVGALVLIALTVWIVWTPQRPSDAEELPMADAMRPNMTPQGDRFEDQYTAATADLSAGGVATSFETTPSYAGRPTDLPESSRGSEPWSSPGLAREGTTQPWSAQGSANVEASGQRGMMLTEPRTIGIGAGALIAVAGGIGGAWLYARWQQERNKPINRFRRGARDLASRLGDRLPDTDDLPPQSGPIGGTAAAVLISSLVLARALRRDASTPQAIVERQRDIIWDLLGMGKDQARRLRDMDVQEVLETSKQAMDTGRQRAQELKATDIQKGGKPMMFGGLGLGGTAIVAGAAYLIWRMLRSGGGQSTPNYYVG
jgi:hypothetical protein